MLIQILSVTVETKPTAKGSYQMAEVAFKNLSFQGKVESKKLMSFGATAPSFAVLKDAAGGSKWEITVVKNPAGYNDWTSATPSDASAAPPAASTAPSYQSATRGAPSATTTKSTYETAEERAARQILIVRQSSLSAAVNCLSTGSKSPPKGADVIAQAKEFEAYVFGREEVGLSTEDNGSIFDMTDDVPL